MKNLILVILLVSAFCHGCSIYKQQPTNMPKEQTAKIVFPARNMFLYRVDGQSTGFFTKFIPNIEPFIITEGKHTFKIKVIWHTEYSSPLGGNRLIHYEGIRHLWLVAEAGKTYKLCQLVSGRKFRLWFENARTKKIIGGIVGSDDEP